MGTSEKLVTIAENIPKVYKSGQASMVDETKIIKKTVSGESVMLDDVSEIPHKIEVKLSSGGKNLWEHGDVNDFAENSGGKKVKLLSGITYTFSALVTSTDVERTTCLVYDTTNAVFLGQINRDVRSSITFTPTKQVNEIRLYASDRQVTSVGDTATFSDIMIEENNTATEYEPYKETLTDYSGVRLNKYGKNLLNQAGMKTGVQSGVTLEYLEDEDCFLLNGTSTANDNKFMTYINVKDKYGEVNTLSVTYISGEVTIPSGSAVFYIGRYGYTDSGNSNWCCVDLTTLNTSITKALTGTQMDRAWIYLTSGVSFVNYKFRIQLEHGSQATPYEKFKGQTLIANADGTVEGVKSISPYMYMTTDNPNCTINAEYHKSYGMQTEYDRFWDTYQDEGNRTDYTNAFSGIGWVNEIFKPKYPIDSPLKYNQLFRFAFITHINYDLNLTKMTNANLVFDSCAKLVKIQKIITNENVTYTQWFGWCIALETIAFDGTIGKSIDFQYSTKLTKASILNIFSVLSSTVAGQTLTLSKTAVTNAFGSTTATEWTNLVATKTNWTISLV